MIIDILIIIFLFFGFLLGFKRGFVKSLVSMFGTLIVFFLAYFFKKPVGNFFSSIFPFFDFNGLSFLNIFLYQALAFILLLILFSVLLRIVISVVSVFEKILNATIILGLAPKILGGILGFIKNYIIVFIILYVLSFPMFSNVIESSKLKNIFLNHSFLENINTEIANIDENDEALEMMIKYNLISEDNQKIIGKVIK